MFNSADIALWGVYFWYRPFLELGQMTEIVSWGVFFERILFGIPLAILSIMLVNVIKIFLILVV